ncbi:MAG: adenine phosphoribosyltransferase [Candidatus Gastranaerophilales bacterium]|nr:adenine phosphoribosyltransferase [Candidatus Gastranaerophilales bacterium]
MEDNIQKIKSMIRDIPNFPKEGILFRDITTALKDAQTLKLTVDEIYEQFKDEKIDYIAGIESRGFIYGMPLAYKLNCGFIPIRKPKKLPAEVISQEYDLEYGTDKIEIHKDALKKGDRVLIVDDLLATGGTAEAAVKLVKQIAEPIGIAFVIELEDLKGREKLPNDIKIVSLVKY